ncbi:MAG: discoidin domain-containing protein, partial [Thermoanaerobaculia bacterium]
DGGDPLPGAIVNLALRGTASQSTTGYGGLPERGIDGNTDGNYGGGSVTHTADGDPAPTWEVELPAAHDLERIVLWNRTDCCSSRLSNFRVSVFDDPEAEVFSEDFFTDGAQSPPPGAGFEIPLPGGTRGRFVRVELLGGNPQGARYLSLAEVEVHGVDAAPPPAENLARGKKTIQSTTAFGGLSSRAVDGDTSGIFSQNSITHTAAGDPQPYWQVDLGAVYSVGRVALWNRLDCCSHRLSNFRLLVLDGALAPVARSDHFTDRGAPAANPYEVVLPPGVLGRHVRIEKLGPDGQNESILSLAEVEVFQGVPGFDSLIGTDVEGDLRGAGSSIYLRVGFPVDDPGALSLLKLRLRYDDGLVAYLNGREVARRNAPASPAWDSRAAGDRPDALAFSVEELNLSEHLDALRPGENVLAIAVWNHAADSSDLALVPFLSLERGGPRPPPAEGDGTPLS